MGERGELGTGHDDLLQEGAAEFDRENLGGVVGVDGRVGVVPGVDAFESEEFEEPFEGGRGERSGAFLRRGRGIGGGSQRDFAVAGDDDFIAAAAGLGGGGAEGDADIGELAGLKAEGEARGLGAEKEGGSQERECTSRYG